MHNNVVQEIKEILKVQRSRFLLHGGDILFERFENGIVYVSLKGMCAHCPSAENSVKFLIEDELKKEIPQVKKVEIV